MNQSRRRADAARNDDLLLDAALELLREKGPDRIAALDLARLAKLTTGAVYARYENNEEILVGLWQHRISGPMRTFFEAALPALTPGLHRADAQAIMAKAISNPHGPLRPGVSLLIASARIPELHEIIVPEIQGWLREMGISDDRSDVASLYKLKIISFVLGCLYFAAADMFDFDDWETIKPLAHYVLEHQSIEGVPNIPEVSPPSIVVTTDNEIRDALVNGAARVIARGGVERATTQRIARAAALPPSALFSEYRTRQALFGDVAEKLLHLIYRGARAEDILPTADQTSSAIGTPTDFNDPRLVMHRKFLTQRGTATSMALLSPAGKEQRRIRLEFHLAAITDPVIKDALLKADALATEHATNLLNSLFGIPDFLAAPTVRMARLLVQGSLLLEEISDSLNGRDLRYVYKPLADGFSQMVINQPLSSIK
ncbi:MAG: TetR/AcrR family transcriptional regulator [Actinomycetes bacterium]